MAIAATIETHVTARTQKFEQGMKRSRQSLKGLTTEIKLTTVATRTLSTAVTRAGAAMLAAMSAGALLRAFNNLRQKIDDIAKTSARLGLVTEQLTALRYAAQVSGVEAATLDMAIQRMTRRIAEAANGTGEAIKALEELGLSAEQLARGTPDEALNAIADALAAVQTQSDRVRLAFKLFDSEGVALLNMLQDGSAALEANKQAAAALGQTVSGPAAAAFERFNDALDRLGAGLSGTVANSVYIRTSLNEWSRLFDNISGYREIEQRQREEAIRQADMEQRQLDQKNRHIKTALELTAKLNAAQRFGLRGVAVTPSQVEQARLRAGLPSLYKDLSSKISTSLTGGLQTALRAPDLISGVTGLFESGLTFAGGGLNVLADTLTAAGAAMDMPSSFAAGNPAAIEEGTTAAFSAIFGDTQRREEEMLAKQAAMVEALNRLVTFFTSGKPITLLEAPF